jgi:hypothetical protein
MAKAPVVVNIGGKQFECLPLSEARFADVAGVYVILCVARGGSWTVTDVLDVGESGQVGSRIEEHERKEQWLDNCRNNTVWVGLHKMPSKMYAPEDRRSLERALRRQYQPPCG